jgi:hypothetical protein
MSDRSLAHKERERALVPVACCQGGELYRKCPGYANCKLRLKSVRARLAGKLADLSGCLAKCPKSCGENFGPPGCKRAKG